MIDNIVLRAVLAEPDILRRVVTDPDNHLDTHPMAWMEVEAFRNITKQAFGKRRFAQATENRQRTYRNYLSEHERCALRLEGMYMRNSVLQGYHLYEEIARVMSIKFRTSFRWYDVKGMLEIASEIIADLELKPDAGMPYAA